MSYTQPDFYHFNEDSIKLVHWAFQRVKNKKIIKCLDIGAGCGVIGMEFIGHKQSKSLRVDFIEKQEKFKDCLNENIKETSSRIYMDDWLSIEGLESDYDLAFSNPPYFFTNDSRPAKDFSRDMCRRIESMAMLNWIDKVHDHLKENGDFFWVYRNMGFVDDYLKSRGHLWTSEKRLTNQNCTFIHWKKSCSEYKD